MSGHVKASLNALCHAVAAYTEKIQPMVQNLETGL
jgi:hypothetical protein